MLVRDVMQTAMVTVSPETSLFEAIGHLVEHRISGLPVVDADGRVVGVLTEKDLLEVHGASPVPRTVAQLMTPSPVTLQADAPLEQVFDVLMSRSFRRVLVEDQGKLVGLVSRADLMPAILDVLQHAAK